MLFPKFPVGLGLQVGLSRLDLIAIAEANALVPGVTYMTTDGVVGIAKTQRIFQPIGPWFADMKRWDVGSATSYTNFSSVYTPPLSDHARMVIDHTGSFTNSTRNKRYDIVLGGVLTDAPGSNNDQLFDRTFSTASNYDWDVRTTIKCLGSAALQTVRAVGTTAGGIGSGVSRMLTQDLTTRKLLRSCAQTVASGSAVAVSNLTFSGGYAYGTVAGGTFTDLALIRSAIMAGAADSGYNVSPAAIDLLTAGLPNPVIAPVGTATSGVTNFRYPVSGSPGAAGGSPTIQLYDSLAQESFVVLIDQGMGV